MQADIIVVPSTLEEAQTAHEDALLKQLAEVTLRATNAEVLNVELAEELKAAADFIEAQFRNAYRGTKKSHVDVLVKEHAILRPLRAVLVKAGAK